MNNKNLFIYGTSLDFISRVVFIVCGFALNILFARYFGVERYGDLALILSILTLLNVFLTNGISNALSRFISINETNQIDVFKKSIILQIVIVISITIFIVLGINPICNYLNINYLKSYLYLILILLPLNAFYYLFIGVLNGLRDFKSQSIINIIYPILRLLLVLFLIFVFKLGITAVIIGTAIAYLPSIYYALQKCHLNNTGVEISYKEIVKFSFKIMLLFLLITIFLNIDLIVIKSLTDNKKDIGLYGAVMSIGKIAYFILYSISTIIFPIISNMKSKGKSHEIPKLLLKVFNFFFGISVLIQLVMIFYSKDILQLLYGRDYAEGYLLLPLYTLGIISLSLTSLISNILFVIYNGKAFLYSSFIVPIIEFAGIYYLYDKMGIYSAVLMFASSVGCMSMLLFLFLKYLSPKSLSFKNLFLILFTVFFAAFLKTDVIDTINILIIEKLFGITFIVIFIMVYLKLYGKLFYTNKLLKG